MIKWTVTTNPLTRRHLSGMSQFFELDNIDLIC